MADGKKAYKFLGRSFDGFDQAGNRKRYENGDMVDLTEDQFKAFRDQFEAPAKAPAPVKMVEAAKVETKV